MENTETLQQIYNSLSNDDQNHTFEDREMTQKIYEMIDNCFDKKSKEIDSAKLLKGIELLNVYYIHLLKFAASEHNYKRPAYIFITFCDYFDLPYSDTFKRFSSKLQQIIEVDTKKIVPMRIINTYKLKEFNSENSLKNVTSLFDLVK
jgi:hypothetical protein